MGLIPSGWLTQLPIKIQLPRTAPATTPNSTQTSCSLSVRVPLGYRPPETNFLPKTGRIILVLFVSWPMIHTSFFKLRLCMLLGLSPFKTIVTQYCDLLKTIFIAKPLQMCGPLAIQRLRFLMDQLLGELLKKWVDCYRKVSDGSVPMASLPWDCPNKGLASTVQSCQRRENKQLLLSLTII